MLYIFILLATGIILQTVFSGLGLFNGCNEGDSFTGCEGDNSINQVCHNGNWQTTNSTKASMTESCFEGKIISKTCTTDSVSCLNSYTVLESKCVSSKPVLTKKICGNSEFCLSGVCIQKPTSCGNGQCDSSEDMNNCPSDCGTLSSWQAYYASVPDSIKNEYGVCLPNSIFDCNKEVFQEAVDQIQAQYNPRSPRQYMDGVVLYVHNLIQYKLNGGNSQCNEDTAYFLQTYLHPSYFGQKPDGNCVDYSALTVSLLKFKGISSRQVSVCLVHDYAQWRCKPYAITGVQTTIQPTANLGYINGLAAGTSGSEPLGHAIAQAYVDGNWLPLDATMGESISSVCLGYSQPLSVSGSVSNPGETCYVPPISYSQCATM